MTGKPKFFNGEKILKIILLLGFGVSVAGLIVFYFFKGPPNTSTYTGPRKVNIEQKNGGYQFYKDGKPFIVKGGTGVEYIKELSETGGNTIMCWDTSRLKHVFEEAKRYNISVIVGLDIPPYKTGFYNNKHDVAKFFNAYMDIVRRYKDNSRLLAWCLGNEVSLPFLIDSKPFYRAYNSMLDSIHNVDPHHPVSTSIINVSIKRIAELQWRVPALDFYQLNIYNSLRKIDHLLARIKWMWDGPYLIGEWAPSGAWEAPVTAWQAPIEYSSTRKAELFYELYTHYVPVKDPRFLGSLVFYWGHRQEDTQSWFSIFNKDGTPNEIKEVLNDCWKDTTTVHLSPKFRSLSIDNLEDKENIILTSGSKHHAALEMQAPGSSDSLRYKWEIYREDWYYARNPPSETGLFADSTLPVTHFSAPQKEGPYRVFITVYNSKGYFATANIPIYVTH